MKKHVAVTKTGKIQQSQGNYYLNVPFFPYGSKLYCKKVKSFLYISVSELEDYDCILRTVLNTAKACNTNNLQFETSIKLTPVLDLMGWTAGDFIQGTQITEAEYAFSLASDYEKQNSMSGKKAIAKERAIGTITTTGHPNYPLFTIKIPHFDKLDSDQMVLTIKTDKNDLVSLTYQMVNKDIAQTFPMLSTTYTGRLVEETTTYKLGSKSTLPKHLVRFFELSAGQVLPVLEQTPTSITFALSQQRDIITNELVCTGTTKMQKIALTKESEKLLQPIMDACVANEDLSLNEVLDKMKKDCKKKIQKAKDSIAVCEQTIREMEEV